MSKTVWLIGAGPMAVEYARVLDALNIEFITIGRGSGSAVSFKEKTGKNVFPGGLSSFLKTKPVIPSHSIVATGVETLAQSAIELINAGVPNILCEKPGGLNLNEIQQVSELAKEKKAGIYLAYNRRFYASVLKAKEIIADDGGVDSFNFEFTEWGHVIEPIVKGPGVKENWFLGNSTHVVDLAFFLGGKPKKLACFTKGSLNWHPSSSVFAGAGISEKGALFSYHANWNAPGRWAVEVLTKNFRLYFKPMEQLHIQKKGSVSVETVNIDDKLDKIYKPGIFLQTVHFLEGKKENFIDIHEQAALMPMYNKIANYKS